MRIVRAIAIGLFISGLGLTASWCVVYAAPEQKFLRGTPLSIRLPEILYIIPGACSIVEWRARLHARANAGAEKWILFGFGSGGTGFSVSGCKATAYDEDPSGEPRGTRWESLDGTATVSCEGQPGGDEYGVIELGCIPYVPYDAYGVAYNRETIRLRQLNVPPAGAEVEAVVIRH